MESENELLYKFNKEFQNNINNKYNLNKQQLVLKHWLYTQFGGGYKWTTFEHNGVLFPPEYIPHNIPLKYKQDETTEIINVQLSPLAEEAAMLYSKYIGSEYVENKAFNRNFWNDWKKMLGKESAIKSLEGCDFTEYKQKLDAAKELKKQLKTQQDSDENKSHDAKQEEDKYKIAVVDGKEQPVGNFRIEPPGIFLGRGDNPQIGRIKSRIYPEDIIINIGKEATVPESLPGHQWEKVIHDRHVEWLASWIDTITGKTKYVWLGAHSDFKASSDQQKFDLARKLKKKIHEITEENEKNLVSPENKMRQVATALYFIDKFALRVGNEKGSQEADTVGVTSLRIEHIEFLDNNTIALDFLGKDSVRYYNKLVVEPIIYKNLLDFKDGKEKDDQLFHLINSNDMNKYLQTFMKDLTAKVFRTYNASQLFQRELRKISKKYEGATDNTLLLDEFNKANAKVAQLCNHQKNVGKSFKGQVDKIDIVIKKIKYQIRKIKASSSKLKTEKIQKLRDKLTKARSKKELKMELKNISLGTSKANYIDPRITVAFLKLHNLPIEKVFSKALRDKFKWAFEADVEYKF